jgi:hypothetical protein
VLRPQYCVELALRKFFRIVRSVRGDNLTEFSVKTPEQCAALITSLFKKLALDLSDRGLMIALDSHYRVRILRKKELDIMYDYTTPRNEGRQTRAQTNRLSHVTPEDQRKSPSRPCLGHLGAQLSAIRKDGRAYSCSHGKECTYRHISIAGKSKQKLEEVVASMTASVRFDLKKAIDDRK